MMSSEKIAKLESKVNDIMSRPTYAVTPAWQAEVAEIRVQIEAIRTGEDVERKEYIRPTIAPSQGASAAAVAPAESHDHSDEAPYVLIFVALLIMTILEWKCADWFGLRGMTLWSVLTVMALIKALWVALYFMHVKFERKNFHLLLGIPIVLVVLVLAMVSPDSHQTLKQYLDFLF